MSIGFTVRTLRSIAARIRFLINQAAELDVELLVLVPQHPAGSALLAEPGVGPVVAAQLLHVPHANALGDSIIAEQPISAGCQRRVGVP